MWQCSTGTIPEWHPAGGKKAWLFADEIVVNPKAANAKPIRDHVFREKLSLIALWVISAAKDCSILINKNNITNNIALMVELRFIWMFILPPKQHD